jgi:ATP-binding cassette subfamily B protein IrtB
VATAEKTRCDDFITALPDGYNTVIGEGGASLSGGEKQRISIALAMLKDAPIVILYGATARSSRSAFTPNLSADAKRLRGGSCK